MTNAMIILTESIKLMEEGVLQGVGPVETVTVVDEEGNEVEKELQMPEPIHTFASWKKLGYKVKQGEKAIAQFPIWKHTTKQLLDENKQVIVDEEGNPIVKDNMFMKAAFFFKASQVEKIAKEVN